jgi:hypothetical protein
LTDPLTDPFLTSRQLTNQRSADILFPQLVAIN